MVQSPVSPGAGALLVIDVQRGLFAKPTPIYRAEELLANIGSLVVRALRRAGKAVGDDRRAAGVDLNE